MRDQLTPYCIAMISLIIGWSGPSWAGQETFPGPTNIARSPSEQASVEINDPGVNDYGLHDYSLWLKTRHGTSKILEFTRSVELEWSSDSKNLYITDFIGSNVSDCIVISNIDNIPTSFSMSKIVQDRKLIGHKWNLDNSHYYMHCDNWVNPDELAFELVAITDDGTRNIFHYTYDVISNIVIFDKR